MPSATGSCIPALHKNNQGALVLETDLGDPVRLRLDIATQAQSATIGSSDKWIRAFV